MQNQKNTLKELANLRSYVHKHFKHQFLCKQAIPLHSHYQLLAGDPRPSSLSRRHRLHHSCTLNHMRELTKIKPTVWNFPAQRQLDQFPKTLGFVPEKRKKNQGVGSCGGKKAGLLRPVAIPPYALGRPQETQAGHWLCLVPFLISYFLLRTSQVISYPL